MDCISNNPLSDDQIHQYLEGTASPEVNQHFAECDFCRQRCAELEEEAVSGNIMPQLAILLHRADCPSSDELGNYHFNLLNPIRRQQIDAHLKLCRFCQEELKEMREFLASEPEPESTGFDITAPNFMFAKPTAGERVALRGGSSLRGVAPEPVMFQAETTTVFLTLVKELNVYNLHGQVKDNEDWDLWSESDVEIWKDGYKIDTIQADDMGNFDYALKETGMIDLRLVAKDKASIIISDIEVED